jgi:uncharacterized protein with PIN domain
MKCPHCKKTIVDGNLGLANFNAEAYGSNTFTFKCKRCKKKYNVHIQRLTKFGEPYKADDKAETSY